MQLYMSYAAHCGLDSFGVVDVGGMEGAVDVFDAEPVGQSDNGPQIAGILYIVQCQTERLTDDGRICWVLGLLEYGQYLLGCFQQAGP